MMTAESVGEVIQNLRDAGIQVWLDGGWGVDALLGEQSRPHSDLDLVIDATTAPEIKACLGPLGFEVTEDAGHNFVMVHPEHGRLDAHGVLFDARGYGSFELPDGRHWPFPPSAFSGSGKVGSCAVHCLSTEAQVQCHGQGYEPAPKDLADMARLQDRFGVVLPLALCPQPDL